MAKTINARITFTEGLLGTTPANKEIYTDYIASKAPNASTLAEELECVSVPDMVAKGTTVFSRTADGKPFIYDYHLKGFFKDACSMLARVAEKDPVTGKKMPCNESSRLTAFKKVIDGLIFVKPRQLVLHMPEGMGLTVCERPLRAATPQGERVALASSEEAPAGTYIDVEILCMSNAHEDAVFEWLAYGAARGIGGWRNSGKGAFTYELI